MEPLGFESVPIWGASTPGGGLACMLQCCTLGPETLAKVYSPPQYINVAHPLNRCLLTWTFHWYRWDLKSLQPGDTCSPAKAECPHRILRTLIESGQTLRYWWSTEVNKIAVLLDLTCFSGHATGPLHH